MACKHEHYVWTETAARCDACALDLTGTRLDPRRAPTSGRDIPPAVRLIAWAREIEMGGWSGSTHPEGIEAFAAAVADELDFAGAAPPGVDDAIVIRLVERGAPGRVVYRDGMVVR